MARGGVDFAMTRLDSTVCSALESSRTTSKNRDTVGPRKYRAGRH